MNIYQNDNGSWVCYESVNGELVTMVYYFTSKRDAMRQFRREIREMKGTK
jgi:hypothetical protein